jgi:DNA (cytosine-5)-methyltransferase 1
MGNKEMKLGAVFSAFDGIGCGRIALDRAGVKFDRYYASEIDRHAMKATQLNYPDVIQVGDIKNIKGKDFPQIDLLMGGSPCQGFSFSGKMLNFEDPRSKLFFEFARLLEEMNPKYFLLENVVMEKKHQDVISKYLGVEPVKINSSRVSAQNRERLYWVNFPIEQPVDRGVKLKDILEDDEMVWPAAIRGRRLNLSGEINKGTIVGRRLNEKGKRVDNNKEIPITQCLEVRGKNRDKSNCLTTVAKDNVLTTLPIGRYPDAFKRNLPFRYYTITELCRLQTIPEDYFDCFASENQIRKMIGNGWTVDVIAHIFKEMFK